MTINANTNPEKVFFVPELTEPEPVPDDELVYLIRKISPVASEDTYSRPFASNAIPTGLQSTAEGKDLPGTSVGTIVRASLNLVHVEQIPISRLGGT